MYLIDLTVKRLSYFSGFQSLSLGFASINDDNINFVFLREVIQSPYNFLTVLSICSWFKHPCLFHNQTPWKDLQCSELPVHAHIFFCFEVQCHGFIGSKVVLELCTFSML